jgi:succinyldiaminopimelate transaminase
MVDLSVGTPVDPTPPVARAALAAAADSPGYPLTAGSSELRAAAAGWLQRRFGVTVDHGAVLPVIGTKELVALLPMLLGAARVGFPALAYPTYDVGARIAGAEPVVTASPAGVDLLWLNSPANPTGAVMPVEELRAVVAAARAAGTVIASDECYADLWYDGPPPASVLSPEVCDGDHRGLLAVHSLSKRSNLAGYRAGFVAGDPRLVARLLEVRRHAGLIVPAPVQAAMAAVLAEDGHAGVQRERYRWRRATLTQPLQADGFAVSGEAGLYLWATRHEDCWATVDWLADRGILVAPGSFYGSAGSRHVRIAMTATDERIAAAAARLG